MDSPKTIYPTWVCRAQWRGTAMNLLVVAKTEAEALNKAEKRVLKMLGGMSCLGIRVLRKQD